MTPFPCCWADNLRCRALAGLAALHIPASLNSNIQSPRYPSSYLPSSTGRLGVRISDAQAALGSRQVCSSSRTYFCVTALVATPPPAEITQTEFGRAVTLARNAHFPSAALTATVAMRAPGQVAPVLTPSWISSLAAKPSPGIREFTPSTRSSPVLRTCWETLMLTVSVAAGGGGGGGGGGAALGVTDCATAGEVLPRKSPSPA